MEKLIRDASPVNLATLVKYGIILFFAGVGVYFGLGIEIIPLCIIVWLILNSASFIEFTQIGVLFLVISSLYLLMDDRDIANQYATLSYITIITIALGLFSSFFKNGGKTR